MKRLLVVPLLALALAAGAACTDDEAADPAPTTTAPTTTAPTPTDEEQLEQLSEDWFEASRAIYLGDEQVESASEFLTGSYLENFEEQASDFLGSGSVARADDRSDQMVETVEVDGSEATVVECVVDADAVIDEASGDVVDDDVAAYRYRSTAMRTDRGWRYSDRETIDEEIGVTQCDG
ncbi:hypothetical protein PO878_06110 [Iamia majanohamensis]|uniref:Nuclear transport factor 2 family protein n=1 Tax=Iamia majanohamensis TaxID=467976 RepID=A0AAE9Y7C6_9ACTN|nr:hypothetical protein [Iamia majanohamensis]WCO68300.1 hypothetical protein PO878_06110 [Iamia majanohamensis]